MAGRRRCESRWGRTVARAETAAGRPTGRASLTMYPLRHTFRAWLYQTGTTNPDMLDYLMGHGIWSMGGRYFHPSLDDVRAAIEKLPSVLKAPSSSKLPGNLIDGSESESA